MALVRARRMIFRCSSTIQHFVLWYARRAQPWIERRCELFARRVSVTIGAVRVMDLGHHWGSCGPTGNLNFNWRTICLPPRIVEYVVVQELVHLVHLG